MAENDPAESLRQSTESADETMGTREAGGAREDCPEKTWIEIQLVGEDDSPIPGEKYEIELPDGSVEEGVLDAEGVVGLEGIDPGTCRIVFPELDQELWERIGEEPN